MARELRGRGVTHVVMEASGVYTDPVYYALRELDFAEVMVINPAHAKALKGHKTDAKDAVRLLDLYECGLLSGSCMPSEDLREVRDLARYRMKTVQARTAGIRRLQKTLETAGIKVSSVVSDVTGGSATAMIEALISGERRGSVMADLDAKIAPLVARYAREAELLKTLPGFGDVIVAGWLGAIGPAPHQHWRPTGFVDNYIMPLAPFSCQFRVHTRRASDTPVPSESSDDCSTLPRTRTKPASHARRSSMHAGG
jgi:hypothetical protein